MLWFLSRTKLQQIALKLKSVNSSQKPSLKQTILKLNKYIKDLKKTLAYNGLRINKKSSNVLNSELSFFTSFDILVKDNQDITKIILNCCIMINVKLDMKTSN